MNSIPPTQPTLLLRIRDAQDHEAWGRFVDLYAPLVYGFLRKRGLQDADAADLTQDVLRQVATAAQQLEYDERLGSFRGWLFTIVQNRLIDHWRKEGIREHGAGTSSAHEQLQAVPQPGLDSTAEWDADYHRQLFQYAASIIRQDFNDATWQAFWKTAVEGQPGKRVSEQLGLTVAAVYLAKGRVMTRLKDQVRQLVGEELPQ
ncbi:MAG: sigma-70 family RNA polymerase sigma factor [Planctomycetes bacterium]|nr:sigma-70 family RNA polymerase sigma factor [Planctomycetota bacterium]